MKKQCPSCGGDCGRTKQTGCQYQGRARHELATGEREPIMEIFQNWQSNPAEACIESYLLGVNNRREILFRTLSDHYLACMTQSLSKFVTENTPERENRAFKDGYHAAISDLMKVLT